MWEMGEKINLSIEMCQRKLQPININQKWECDILVNKLFANVLSKHFTMLRNEIGGQWSASGNIPLILEPTTLPKMHLVCVTQEFSEIVSFPRQKGNWRWTRNLNK